MFESGSGEYLYDVKLFKRLEAECSKMLMFDADGDTEADDEKKTTS